VSKDTTMHVLSVPCGAKAAAQVGLSQEGPVGRGAAAGRAMNARGAERRAHTLHRKMPSCVRVRARVPQGVPLSPADAFCARRPTGCGAC
jgi:hypothetical protein